jgi:UDP-N-acetylmuramoyl-tripeptide--D-alanyl-D-alanine ligase
VTADGPTLEVRRSGDLIARAEVGDARPTNVACAVAVALELGVADTELSRLLPGLPLAPNRLNVAVGPAGVTVVDDTYNSNPAGSRVALDVMGRHSSDGHRRVVVTPGMVELGDRQHPENVSFASSAREVATDLVIVGFTNRRALLEGAGEHNVRISGWRAGAGGYTVEGDESDEEDEDEERVGSHDEGGVGDVAERDGAQADHAAQVVLVGSRDEAVSWVRAHLRQGDVVLYENDLPDHFP